MDVFNEEEFCGLYWFSLNLDNMVCMDCMFVYIVCMIAF